MKEQYRKINKGIATIELLMAFAIFVLNITAIILLVNGGQSIHIDSETNTEAIAKASGMLEQARADSEFDFNLVNSSSTTETSGALTYTKVLEVAQVDSFTKEVTSTVSWLAEGGRTLNILLKTLLTNPGAVSGGDTCSSELVGDWTNPTKVEYEFGAEILNDTSSGFPISSIQTFDKKMYVTVNNDNGNNPGTFFVLDISDPTVKPVLLSPSLFDNSPVGEGLNSVAFDGDRYAYVASAYTSANANCVENNNCAQLQVIDVGNPAVPSMVKNFKINSVTASNRLTAGTSVFYKDGVVYLGTTKAGAGYDEFFVIDVGGVGGGTPTNPAILDSVKIDNGVNAIFVRDNYAYVASPNNEELKIFDVSSPSSVSQVGHFNAPGGGGNFGNGKSLYLVGSKLYLGRTLLNGNEFYILNNSDPATDHQPPLGSKNIQDGDDGQPPAPTNTSINGIIVRNYLAFLITNGEFQIYNVSNPGSIVRYATPLILPPGSGGLQGTATDCEGNYIYVGSMGSNDKGYISVITGS